MTVENDNFLTLCKYSLTLVFWGFIAKGTGPHRVTGPESTAWLLQLTVSKQADFISIENNTQ